MLTRIISSSRKTRKFVISAGFLISSEKSALAAKIEFFPFSDSNDEVNDSVVDDDAAAAVDDEDAAAVDDDDAAAVDDEDASPDDVIAAAGAALTFLVSATLRTLPNFFSDSSSTRISRFKETSVSMREAAGAGVKLRT